MQGNLRSRNVAQNKVAFSIVITLPRTLNFMVSLSSMHNFRTCKICAKNVLKFIFLESVNLANALAYAGDFAINLYMFFCAIHNQQMSIVHLAQLGSFLAWVPPQI